jgi:uncharacterized protein
MLNFKPLTPADFPRLEKYFQNQPHQLCAYSLASVIAWSNEIYQPYATLDDDILMICAEYATEYEKRHLILPMASDRQFDPQTIHKLAEKAGFAKYQFVPDDYITTYGRDRIETLFTIEEHTEYDDYIYLASDLAQLGGNRFAKKRNLIRQFERSHVETDRVQVEPMTSAVSGECIEFLEKWCETRDCEAVDSDLLCEKLAALKTIENLELMDMRGLLLRIDGAVSAFGMASHLTNEMGVLHFEKAFAEVKGLYQYFDRLCARRLFEGYTYINKESDMNEPGLKKAKRSYHPVKLVKSYTLRLK